MHRGRYSCQHFLHFLGKYLPTSNYAGVVVPKCSSRWIESKGDSFLLVWRAGDAFLMSIFPSLKWVCPSRSSLRTLVIGGNISWPQAPNRNYKRDLSHTSSVEDENKGASETDKHFSSLTYTLRRI